MLLHGGGVFSNIVQKDKKQLNHKENFYEWWLWHFVKRQVIIAEHISAFPFPISPEWLFAARVQKPLLLL